jgi:hypothetical protein
MSNIYLKYTLLFVFLILFQVLVLNNIQSSVFMAFCRPSVIYLLSPKHDFEPGIRPCIKDLGFRWFFAYSLILILLHHLVLFYIEVFRFSEFFSTLYKVTISTAFTLVLVILSQYLFYNLKKT